MNSIDLTGQRFGRLIAVKYVGKSKWKCRCDCGNMITVLSNNLRRGNTTSCGCLKKDKLHNRPLNRKKIKGVSFNAHIGKWFAYITAKGKRYDLGYYGNQSDAVAARKSAEKKYIITKNNTVDEKVYKKPLKKRICHHCGKEFLGQSNAVYCPSCKKEVKLNRAIKYRKDKAAGKIVPVKGSTRTCAICGKEFIVKNSQQTRKKFCDECLGSGAYKEYRLRHRRDNLLKAKLNKNKNNKKLDNLVGQKFGRLVVVKDNGGGKITCRCQCGTIKEYNKSNVKQGLTTSCGCAHQGHAMSHVKNTVGQRFGKLVVLEELTGGKVKCRCDCGNIKTINKAHLLHGDITSCGCAQKEMAKKNREPFLYCGTDINKIKASNATSRSKSGVRGVCWDDRKGKWRANIGFKGQKFDLGSYDNVDDAIAARKAAEEKYYRPVIKEWESSHDK